MIYPISTIQQSNPGAAMVKPESSSVSALNSSVCTKLLVLLTSPDGMQVHHQLPASILVRLWLPISQDRVNLQAQIYFRLSLVYAKNIFGRDKRQLEICLRLRGHGRVSRVKNGAYLSITIHIRPLLLIVLCTAPHLDSWNTTHPNPWAGMTGISRQQTNDHAGKTMI